VLSCDWCEMPIEGRGRAYKMTLEALSILDLDRKVMDTPDIAGELHFHAKPCQGRFLRAARTVAREHLPLDDETEHERGESLEDEKPTRPEREKQPYELREEAWEELPAHERERLVLELFDGTAWLTNRDVKQRLGAEDKPCPYDIAPITRHLAKAGELEKELGQWGKCRVRYKRAEPSEQVKDLQRMLDEGGEG
jgi:hypothetical protein